MSTARADHASLSGSFGKCSLSLLRSLVLCIALAGGALAAIFWADPLLTVRGGPAKADVIVVLGGDGPARADHASDLWLEGRAPIILISGDGDCFSIRYQMMRNGVPRSAIQVECLSGSTWQNALYSAPYLERLNVRSAIMVTNWFHSRRAVESFAAICPHIRWISSVVEPRRSFWRTVSGPYGIAILKEYPKLLWYKLRYFSAGREQQAVAGTHPCFEMGQRS